MAKSRSVSVTGAVYERLREAAKAEGISVSSLVERAITPALGVTVPKATTWRNPKRRIGDV